MIRLRFDARDPGLVIDDETGHPVARSLQPDGLCLAGLAAHIEETEGVGARLRRRRGDIVLSTWGASTLVAEPPWHGTVQIRAVGPYDDVYHDPRRGRTAVRLLWARFLSVGYPDAPPEGADVGRWFAETARHRLSVPIVLDEHCPSLRTPAPLAADLASLAAVMADAVTAFAGDVVADPQTGVSALVLPERAGEPHRFQLADAFPVGAMTDLDRIATEALARRPISGRQAVDPDEIARLARDGDPTIFLLDCLRPAAVVRLAFPATSASVQEVSAARRRLAEQGLR